MFFFRAFRGGGEFPPKTLTNLSGQLDVFHFFSPNKSNSPPPPPQTTFLEKTLQIAIEVLETLQSGATGLCFIIKVWLVTLTDKNTLASNRQHVCHSEGLRKFMVTCIDNISIRIKLKVSGYCVLLAVRKCLSNVKQLATLQI